MDGKGGRRRLVNPDSAKLLFVGVIAAAPDRNTAGVDEEVKLAAA